MASRTKRGPRGPRAAAMTPEALKAVLARLGINQAEAARRLGVSEMAVSTWVRGTTPISAGVAALIRERLSPDL